MFMRLGLVKLGRDRNKIFKYYIEHFYRKELDVFKKPSKQEDDLFIFPEWQENKTHTKEHDFHLWVESIFTYREQAVESLSVFPWPRSMTVTWWY